MGATQDKNKNLISTYRLIICKIDNNKSGNDKMTSQFYEQLDAILGHRPASTPPVVLDACAGGLSALPEEREDSDSELRQLQKPPLMSIGNLGYLCPMVHVGPHRTVLLSLSIWYMCATPGTMRDIGILWDCTTDPWLGQPCHLSISSHCTMRQGDPMGLYHRPMVGTAIPSQWD